jgi:tetratricopeptide (TPR) repeat protein
MIIKLHEVPVAELDDYRSFIKNLQNDVAQYVRTSPSIAAAVPNNPLSSFLPTGPLPGTPPSLLSEAMKLPGSNSSEANQLEADAYSAVRRGDHPAALSAFKLAVEADPAFMRARLELAAGYIAEGQNDSARAVLLKAIESDPRQMIARRSYISVLVALRRTDEAIDATREAVKIAPDDPDANAALGALLLGQKRYADALPYLETAEKNGPSRGNRNILGVAYLRTGQIEKGSATLEKVVADDPRPEILNDISYELADAKADLPKALGYAQRAVDEEEKESHNVELSNLLSEPEMHTEDRNGLGHAGVGSFPSWSSRPGGKLPSRGVVVAAGWSSCRSPRSSL